MNPLSGQTELLAKLIDASEARHRVISHNIANVNTPGYHRLEISFDDYLANASRGSTSGPVEQSPLVHEEQGLPERADGNNVDIDRESVQLEKNALTYQSYSQLLAAQLQMMRKAIEG